jgi:hypothetical protein
VRCEGLGPLNFGHWSLFRISRFVLRIWPLGLRASAGGEMRKTNPISPGRRVNVQNEPNFGQRRKMSGGDAQPPIRSGAGSTKRRNVQNEPNSARAPGNGRGPAGAGAPPESDCAKRTQFLYCGLRIVRNEPNSSIGDCGFRDAYGLPPSARCGPIVRNEAKLGRTGVYGQGQSSCGAWLGRGVKRAKRTQFQRGVSSLKFQVSSRKSQASRPLTSHFTLQTPRPTLRGRGYVQNEPNLWVGGPGIAD